MSTYKTPDVYVKEISTFPPSVAEVETAVPAFIGYTEKADKNGDSLTLKPTKIFSLKEYEQYFGGPKDDEITLTVSENDDGSFKVDSFVEPTLKYIMYFSLKMFFNNGGGQCYIISVGDYTGTGIEIGTNNKVGLKNGLAALKNEDEPTLIVIPESIKLTTSASYEALSQAVLLQCSTLQDRFAVFDIYKGEELLDPAAQLTNRAFYGNNHLKYGATYYPFLKTSLNYAVNEEETNVKVTYPSDAAPPATTTTDDLVTLNGINTALYNFVLGKLKERYVVLPASPAVVGVYASVDSNRGVWKAPANVSLTNVIEPVVKIDNAIQDGLNVDATTGKSINAIRSFMGKGTLVWGARTLAGNDNEWRYIPVRRFFSMVEESIKKSTYWAVFEPNDANTWTKIRGMIEAYLTQKWRDGALVGATPDDAFFVRCGLGITMDSQDILEGRLNVEIGMAVARPAEFIILKFSHKLQTS
jgi:phage tail sheath protein FI